MKALDLLVGVVHFYRDPLKSRASDIVPKEHLSVPSVFDLHDSFGNFFLRFKLFVYLLVDKVFDLDKPVKLVRVFASAHAIFDIALRYLEQSVARLSSCAGAC